MINFSLANISALCVHGGTTLNGGASVHSLTNNYSTARDPFADTITVRQDESAPRRAARTTLLCEHGRRPVTGVAPGRDFWSITRLITIQDSHGRRSQNCARLRRARRNNRSDAESR